MITKSKATSTDTKTGAADAAQTGEMLPAMGTAGATADAAGDNTPAADAGDVWPTPTPPTVIVKGPVVLSLILVGRDRVIYVVLRVGVGARA